MRLTPVTFKPFLFFAALLVPLLSNCGYNSLQGLDEQVKASWSEVENQYQRRAELIPNLVNTVKGYAKHESQTLEAVMKARAEATQVKLSAESLSDPAAIQKFQQAQAGVSSALSRLLAVAENYPNLKANDNFRDLQAQLEGTENRIAVARKRYIDLIASYNTAIRSFPTNLTAKFLLGLKTREPFTVAEELKVAPKVEF
jgi:LemA protein